MSGESFEEAQAIHVAAELYVTDHDIGIKFDDQALGRVSIADDADEGHRVTLGDRPVDGVEDRRMVVDGHDPDRRTDDLCLSHRIRV